MQTRGCHAPIRHCTKLVESAEDVLEDLPPLGAKPMATPEVEEPPQQHQAMLDARGFDPVSHHALMVRGG
ncbi:hypothetical protein [Pelomonas cellulosilytica]|uniref:Uncharacterized protein n=1 Tax=Pelomonas cellulosilytica TaxID=2906762 RepID=A0ABS8XTR5_9BURK|nr:hypothetical protein [Pelomonas sp. P8]MCE4554069.1 hypothetical protein [Pelomonas sp. P8]